MDITSREIDPRSLDDDPAPEDLLAIAAMLHTDSSLLLDRTFAKTPAPIRSFVSLSGRRRVCRTCAEEFWSSVSVTSAPRASAIDAVAWVSAAVRASVRA